MMSSLRVLISVLLVACHAASNDNWESKVDEDGRNVQSLKIEAPAMTEEDQYGYTMPDQYRCDSCKVVAYHLTEALKHKQPKNRRLKEWEYTELFDETCKAGFKGYGISLVDGQNVLSGPAIKRDNVQPGMGAIQMGGETWEKRLGEICRKIVYEKIGEDEVYEHFRSQGEVSSELCFTETRDCKKETFGPKTPTKKGESPKPASGKKLKKDKAVGAAEGNVKAESLDVSAFISKLAKKHGKAPIEYTKKRSFEEWEHLLVQAATRISDQGERQTEQLVGV